MVLVGASCRLIVLYLTKIILIFKVHIHTTQNVRVGVRKKFLPRFRRCLGLHTFMRKPHYFNEEKTTRNSHEIHIDKHKRCIYNLRACRKLEKHVDKYNKC